MKHCEPMKIAAYCRVSTEKDDQLMSLQTQKEFFTEYAEKNHLDLVELYADEGISGTKLKNRKEFNRMMKDAEQGKFACVFVKDVSRLARNVVDFLQSIRKLKALDIDCRFVTANMSTNDGELTLTILAAVAQEESANLSKRVKFGKKRNAEKGRVPNIVYGYDKIAGEYFNLRINPMESEIVRRMFDLYVNQGYGWNKIAYQLNEEGIKTKRKCKWHPHSVGKLLTNPLYTGKIINAKSYVKDFLTGKRELNQEQDHIVVDKPELAIIDEYTFKKAQKIKEQRNEAFHHTKERQSNQYCFSTLIKCESCGYSFRRVYRKYVKEYIRWACSGRNAQGVDFCDNRTIIDEQELLGAIRNYFSGLVESQDKLIERTIVELKKKYKPRQDEEGEAFFVKELARLKRTKAKQTEMFEEDAITMHELKERVKELNAEINRCAKHLQLLKASRSALDQIDQIVRKHCNNMQDVLAGEVMDNVMLKKVIEKIMVNADGDIKVRLKLFSELELDYVSGI